MSEDHVAVQFNRLVTCNLFQFKAIRLHFQIRLIHMMLRRDFENQ